jgi:hypothetical protein
VKTIFKFFIAALFTLGVASSYAEPLAPEAITIEIDDGILKINGQQIDMPTDLESFVELLGPYSRGDDNRKWGMYIWNDYGIRALSNKEGKIHDFSLYFRELPDQTPMVEDDRLPNKCFSGNFILEGIKLDSSLSLYDYNKMVTSEHRFKKDYVSTLYSTSGVRQDNSDYVFDVSARIDRNLKAYKFEVNYNYVPPFKPDPNTKHDHNRTEELVESLKKDGNDLVDRAMKLLDMECEEK